MIKMFYYDPHTDMGVEGEESIVCSESETIDYFTNLTKIEDNFLGIFKGEDTLQFAWLRDDIWLVDIPKVLRQGSYQKEATTAECIELIKKQYEYFDLSFSENYEFNEW